MTMWNKLSAALSRPISQRCGYTDLEKGQVTLIIV